MNILLLCVSYSYQLLGTACLNAQCYNYLLPQKEASTFYATLYLRPFIGGPPHPITSHNSVYIVRGWCYLYYHIGDDLAAALAPATLAPAPTAALAPALAPAPAGILPLALLPAFALAPSLAVATPAAFTLVTSLTPP